MTVTLLFWLLTLSCCLYAASQGQADGKVAASLCVCASLASMPVQWLSSHWLATNLWVMLVDCALFAALYRLALLSRRCWPVWMAGFQLVTVGTHVASLIGPSFPPRIYAAMATFWSIPVLLAMLIGVVLDNRSGLHRRASPAQAPRSTPP